MLDARRQQLVAYYARSCAQELESDAYAQAEANGTLADWQDWPEVYRAHIVQLVAKWINVTLLTLDGRTSVRGIEQERRA
jgi:hypothetical protein